MNRLKQKITKEGIALVLIIGLIIHNYYLQALIVEATLSIDFKQSYLAPR